MVALADAGPAICTDTASGFFRFVSGAAEGPAVDQQGPVQRRRPVA
ncbi:hypothetical protein QE399_002511 [Paracidovorax wautersii]|uniref:Uncharacterized protein n=1 Tax=Paracidovorax wautersii TaxID=1177982 RepID=A0ABU1IC67_9BURK|nr:hypothetical protein [Paracidovorax wautersii]